MLATIVDIDALWQTVWTASVAGIGVAFVYACAVVGFTRSLEMRRADRPGAGVAYALMALLGAAGTVGAIAWAIILITTK